MTINNFLSSSSVGRNCEEDSSRVLHNFSQIFSINNEEERLPSITRIERVPSLLYTRRNIYVGKCIKVYMAGFLARRIHKLVGSCQVCKNLLMKEYQISSDGKDHEEIIDARQYSVAALCRPNTFFSFLFIEAFALITYILPNVCHIKSLLYNLQLFLMENLELNPIRSCTQHDLPTVFCKNISFITLKAWLNKINKILRGADNTFIKFMQSKKSCQDKIKVLAYKKYLYSKKYRNRN